MARILITGSSDGLGLLAGQLLASQHHEVVAHARNESRAADTVRRLPEAPDVVVGDLSTLAGMRRGRGGGERDGPFRRRHPQRRRRFHRSAAIVTPDGLCHVFAINVLAPYLLTAACRDASKAGLHELRHAPRRARASLDDLQWEHRRWSGSQAYSDSKLFVAVLAAAVARHPPDVFSNAVDPGWVATKMGGPGAPDDLGMGLAPRLGWPLATTPRPCVSGAFFFHQRRGRSRIPPCTTSVPRRPARVPAPASERRGAVSSPELSSSTARPQARTTSIVDRVGSAAYATRTPSAATARSPARRASVTSSPGASTGMPGG